MKKISFFRSVFCLILFLFVYDIADAQIVRWIKVGKVWNRVRDSGHQTELKGATSYYYHLYDFGRYGLECAGTRFGVRDWTDENGNVLPVKIAGAPYGASDEVYNMFALKDEEGISIRRYWRYKPPSIVVDGVILEEPFPLPGDEVAPEKIPGTADVMVESFIRNYMGLDIHQRVFGWNQTNHDDYVLYDWTITNTGNIDKDDDIECLQTLKDLYILRSCSPMPCSDREQKEWSSWYGCRPGEELRIMYNYPHRDKGAKFDDFGDIRGALTSQGFLNGPCYEGEAMIHVDKSPDDPTDDPAQPQMHSIWNFRLFYLKNGSEVTTPEDHAKVYEVMQYGLHPSQGTPYMEGTYPGTYHEVNPEERGYKYVNDFPGWGFGWHTILFNSSGPFTLEPGEDLRFAYSQVWGSISLEESWRIGTEWLNGTCEPPPGNEFGVKDNLPPQYKQFPDLYVADTWSTEYNNWAKDCWVCTGKDSLFNNALASQWAVRNDYDVPIPPSPPSIEINSRPDRVEINWGNESETASDFAGYRVYRAVGATSYSEEGGIIVGKWTPIFECGKGTANPLTHIYEDVTAERGQGYYYYVAAFDDGISNKTDYNGIKESLQSGQYLNMVTQPAYLTRTAGTLSTVRVVPNPFNIGAAELQYVGEPDKIMFMDIPGYCTIKIYSESGDLVKTLIHDDGSGDESWGDLLEEHSTTEDGQIIVSGIYIALIEENNKDGTPTGNTTFVKFVIVR